MGHSRFRPTQLAWLGATLLALAMAAPVSTQAQVVVQFGRPQARGFSNNYPWFNNVPQYSESQSFQYFLAYHPDIAQALSINPGLLYNAAWRSENPDLEQYLNTHPTNGRRLTMQTGPPGRPKPSGVTTIASTNGAMPIGGMRTMPTGFTTIIRIGLRSIRASLTRRAPTTSRTSGIMVNGGMTRIRVG